VFVLFVIYWPCDFVCLFTYNVKYLPTFHVHVWSHNRFEVDYMHEFNAKIEYVYNWSPFEILTLWFKLLFWPRNPLFSRNRKLRYLVTKACRGPYRDSGVCSPCLHTPITSCLILYLNTWLSVPSGLFPVDFSIKIIYAFSFVVLHSSSVLS
jgi:hypothetical protein